MLAQNLGCPLQGLTMDHHVSKQCRRKCCCAYSGHRALLWWLLRRGKKLGLQGARGWWEAGDWGEGEDLLGAVGCTASAGLPQRCSGRVIPLYNRRDMRGPWDVAETLNRCGGGFSEVHGRGLGCPFFSSYFRSKADFSRWSCLRRGKGKTCIWQQQERDPALLHGYMSEKQIAAHPALLPARTDTFLAVYFTVLRVSKQLGIKSFSSFPFLDWNSPFPTALAGASQGRLWVNNGLEEVTERRGTPQLSNVNYMEIRLLWGQRPLRNRAFS